tara:strand:- start:465 stop:845 length:381 start_codon:yes stop_codon:yes gene_type:complete
MKIKIYYEDTDASGRVYHSNYLKYFERGRTDFLYRLGFNHKTLLERYELYFVVKACDINFKKPAYFEDELVVETNIEKISKVKIIFHQMLKKENVIIVDSKVTITPININGKITKMPNEMLEKLTN